MKNINIKNYSIVKLLIFAAVLLGLQTTQIFARNLPKIICLIEHNVTDNAVEYRLIKNPDAKCQKVYDVLRSVARTTVLGGKDADYEYLMTVWIREIAATDKELKSLEGDFAAATAEKYLKSKLAAEKYYQSIAVTNAYLDALGRKPTKIEIQAYGNLMVEQKSWYSHALAGEIITMNKLPKVREEMINRAYLATTGSPANGSNLQYWKPRVEHYKLLVEAIRK